MRIWAMLLGSVLGWSVAMADGDPPHPASAQPGTRVVVLSREATAIRIELIDGDVQKITLNTVEDSPLLVDNLLLLRAARSIPMSYDITEMSRLKIARILALPSGSGMSDKKAAENSDLRWPIKDALFDLEHVQKHWAWPEREGIPLLVTYTNGSWGILNIVPSVGQRRTSITHRIFDAPAPQNFDELYHRVIGPREWPDMVRIEKHQMRPQNFLGLYLRQNLQSRRTLDMHTNDTTGLTRSYHAVRQLFAQARSVDADIIQKFSDVWNACDTDAHGVFGRQDHRFFATSHWAVIDLLNHASPSNLELLLSRFENRILFVMSLVRESLSPKFYAGLFLANRDYRVIALNHLVNHSYFNRPGTAEAVAKIDTKLKELFEFEPLALFSSIRQSDLSDATIQFLVSAYLRTPSRLKTDALALEWMMELVHEGRDTHAIRGYLNHFRRQEEHRAVFETALDMGRERNLDCDRILAALGPNPET
ncbi:MAG TPA: hypothetical protein VM901_12535 [Bdellovibrionota bacterium]|nr:hypothetical protein [Bdellovibrionota bacterium]